MFSNLFENKKITQGIVLVVAASLCIFFLSHAKNGMRFTSKDQAPATITVTGEGEYFAVPDVATFSFSVEKEGKTQKEAQDAGATVINTIIDALKKDYGMSDTKDLKTTSLSVSPKYDYGYVACITYPCPTKSPKITGYTFNQTVEVKIKDLDKVGEISAKLAEWGATNTYGPNFTLANEDEAHDKARVDAITDAKVKAIKLSKQLGVKLGKIQSYSESTGGMYPMYAGATMRSDMAMEKSVAPTVPTGENKYSSNVTIVYEIR